jgi:hypothetical protein
LLFQKKKKKKRWNREKLHVFASATTNTLRVKQISQEQKDKKNNKK